MLEDTAKNYSRLFTPDITKKLEPINIALDSMLIRLEEFETMISLLHEENVNTCGLNGSLMAVLENKAELKSLFERIDALEKMVEHVKKTVNCYEMKIEAAERDLGLMQTSSKIKDFLKPLLKLNMDNSTLSGDVEQFEAASYFPDNVEDVI